VAIGLSNAIGGGLMSLAPTVLGMMIAQFDWRVTWIRAGVAVWLIVVPIARWGLRNTPADVGQALDGGVVDDAAQNAAHLGWRRDEAVRTMMFWAVASAVATSGMITTGLAFHQSRCLASAG
jgi:sugar phosphate permease